MNIGFEGDYFSFNGGAGPSADTWSYGTFVSYEFDPKFVVALRAEYLDDAGGNIKGTPHRNNFDPANPGNPQSQFAGLSPDTHGNVGSLALALNFKPVKSVKIQPEIRYDTSTYAGAYDGKNSRWIAGIGISYLF